MSRHSGNKEIGFLEQDNINYITNELNLVNKFRLNNTSRKFNNYNNLKWYNEIIKEYPNIGYHAKTDYLNMYEELAQDDPLITKKELERYLDEFENLIGHHVFNRRHEFDNIFYFFKYYGRDNERNKKYKTFKKFIKFVEDKGLFRYSYFELYRNFNYKVQAKFGELEFTPENFELVYPNLTLYPLREFFIKNDGFYQYYVEDNRTNEFISISPSDLINIASLSDEDIKNGNFHKKFLKMRQVLLFLKDFTTNPKVLPKTFTIKNGRYEFNRGYSIPLSSKELYRNKGYTLRDTRYIGFKKIDLQYAIEDSGLPLNKNYKPLRNLAVKRKKSKYGKRFDYLPGFRRRYLLHGNYYVTLYRYLFNTLIYVDWKDLCPYTISKSGYDTIKTIAKTDFQVSEQELNQIHEEEELCELLQDISDERKEEYKPYMI